MSDIERYRTDSSYTCLVGSGRTDHFFSFPTSSPYLKKNFFFKLFSCPSFRIPWGNDRPHSFLESEAAVLTVVSILLLSLHILCVFYRLGSSVSGARRLRATSRHFFTLTSPLPGPSTPSASPHPDPTLSSLTLSTASALEPPPRLLGSCHP